jgi:hypothetical protein
MEGEINLKSKQKLLEKTNEIVKCAVAEWKVKPAPHAAPTGGEE